MEAKAAQSKSTENAGKLRKRGKRGGIGGWREGRGRKELTASWIRILIDTEGQKNSIYADKEWRPPKIGALIG